MSASGYKRVRGGSLASVRFIPESRLKQPRHCMAGIDPQPTCAAMNDDPGGTGFGAAILGRTHPPILSG